MQRIESLDYLRGLCALSIMLFHYASWTKITPTDAHSFLGRIGIYGVSTFYILSGLNLFLVYQGRIHNWQQSRDFLLKRFFRIFPLFWLATTLVIGWNRFISQSSHFFLKFSGLDIFLNYSLLFSFFKPTAYLATGAWSIGNEIVFYSFFPLLLLLAHKHAIFLPATTIVSLAIAAYFAFVEISAATGLDLQWATYINPLNQWHFFYERRFNCQI